MLWELSVDYEVDRRWKLGSKMVLPGRCVVFMVPFAVRVFWLVRLPWCSSCNHLNVGGVPSGLFREHFASENRRTYLYPCSCETRTGLFF